MAENDTEMTLPTILSAAATGRLGELLTQATADSGVPFIALHDHDTGFAVFVEMLAGAPVLWRITGPMLPAQAGLWFQSLADSLAGNVATRGAAPRAH
ncbi:MAG: hypothetical protein MK141_14505 [Pseudoxanthomonas sp.]|uniref:hypothetical protein n=1 Tax=Pseudoxanthomonas sp. TaxID=1871049 RepID=UPI00258DA1AD|nr:hypothetical protein [Pseudoxanthomonas sp.]MCH2092771.1 hypothetical protein [Pseudoxanthomonas sp.]